MQFEIAQPIVRLKQPAPSRVRSYSATVPSAPPKRTDYTLIVVGAATAAALLSAAGLALWR